MPKDAATSVAGHETSPAFDVPWFLTFSAGGDSTRRSYRFLLGRMQGMVGRPLAEATVRELETLKAELRKLRSGLQFVRVLRMFYLRCAKASNDPAQRFRFEQLADAAVMKSKKPRMDPSDILTPDEVNLLINAALTLRDRALFGLLYETGCRISEALALNWSDVTYEPAADGRPETFVVWFRTMKITGSEHQGFVIDTAPVFKAWTEGRPNDAKAVFCTIGKGGTYGRLGSNGAWRRVTRAAVRAGIAKSVHPHSFRHARATHLLASGWTEARVKALLGWSPGSRMLDRYSHLTGGDVKRALLQSKGFKVPDQEAPTFTYRPEAVPASPVKALAGALPHAGRPFDVLCPRCQEPNPTHATYCLRCGGALGTAGIEDAAQLDRLAALLEDPEVREVLVRRLRGAKSGS
jgi:integrase